MKFEQLKEELKHKERSIDDLVSYLGTRTSKLSPNYNLLLGAGASVTSGISSGQELVSTWRKDIYELLSGDKYTTEEEAKKYLITQHGGWYTEQNEYSSLFEKKFDLPSQRRRFVENQVDGAIPSIGYAYLVSLANMNDRYFDSVYTTNFDDLLNEAFYQFSHNRPQLCAHDSGISSISISSTRPKIIKLHGDYLFDDIKSTLRETESLEVNIKNKLIEFSKDYGLIVVGYSGSDRSIMDVLNHMLKSEDYFKNGIYWCIRKGSEISPELRKLLWKDRVYYVEMTGFDELFSELHHKIKGVLSLKDNFIESKQERIIQSFQEDKYSLSTSSEYIRSDIQNLIKHKTELDISKLISELNNKGNEVDDENISENEFKSLLEIETKIKSGLYNEAKILCEQCLSTSPEYSSEIMYIKKLIFIYKKTGDTKGCLSYCDKLIELDPNNFNYYIHRSEHLDSIKESYDYALGLSERFKNSYIFNNYLAGLCLDYSRSTLSDGKIISTALSFVEKSLFLDPSLDNRAWGIKISIYKYKYRNDNDQQGVKEYKKLVKEHIEKAKEINKTHLSYLDLVCNEACRKVIEKTTKNCIDELIEAYKTSSLRKQKSIFERLCEEHLSLFECEDKDIDPLLEIKNFYDSDIYIDSSKRFKSSIECLFRASYEININKDVNKYRDYIYKSTKMPGAHKQAKAISSILLDILGDITHAEDFLNSIRSEISSIAHNSIMYDIQLTKREYESSLDYLDKALALGMEKTCYLISKSFILLKSEEYQRAIALINGVLSDITSPRDRAILQLNQEYAKYKLHQNTNTTLIRSIIGQNHGISLNLCGYALLGQDNDVKRIILAQSKKDNTSIESYLRWPILCEKYQAQLEKESLFRTKLKNVA